jgi:hypothetical protein
MPRGSVNERSDGWPPIAKVHETGSSPASFPADRNVFKSADSFLIFSCYRHPPPAKSD